MPKIHLSYQWLPDAAATATTSPLHHPLMALLQAVRAHGSISSAARSLGLSYRHVWGELRRWEQTLGQTLIVWDKGQPARLTALADKLLWAERQAQARLAPQISALQAELERTFATAFDAQSHVLTLYASHDDALVRLREQAASEGLHLDIRFCGSVDAIRALNEGRCTLAGFHVPRPPDAQSLVAKTYRPLLRLGMHKLIGFAVRRQGLMVQTGNPLQIFGWEDLQRADVRIVNRCRGTGTRLCLDSWLQSRGLDGGSIAGYDHEEPSHAAVATAIASGQAHTGLGIESAARSEALDFVPLVEEDYWLVALKAGIDDPALGRLQRLLAGEEWQEKLAAIDGYAVAQGCGQVHALKKQLPWWGTPASHHAKD